MLILKDNILSLLHLAGLPNSVIDINTQRRGCLALIERCSYPRCFEIRLRRLACISDRMVGNEGLTEHAHFLPWRANPCLQSQAAISLIEDSILESVVKVNFLKLLGVILLDELL